MGLVKAVSTAAMLAASAVVVTAIPASASEDWGLNGTYSATSNGEWAKKNEVFRDEAVVRATWTVSTQCSYPTECTGTVRSDQGWDAPIYRTGGV